MMTDMLSEIWAGNMEARDISDLSVVPQMLSSLVALPIVCFKLNGDLASGSATAFFADLEMLPGATLADVLFEECGIEVTDDTIIYVEGENLQADASTSASTLGQIIGNIIVRLASYDDGKTALRSFHDGSAMAQARAGDPLAQIAQ